MWCQPIHPVTNILDLRYDNMDLIPENYQLAIDCLIKYPKRVFSAEVKANFCNFQAKEGFYSNGVIWRSSK